MPVPLHSEHFPAAVGAPRMARAWVKDLLGAVSPPERLCPDVAYDLALCTSELVTLSLTAHSTAITLRVLVDADVIRLSLFDDCPVLTDRDDTAFHAQSMGLRVIEARSESSGITAAGGGRELWAQFRIPGPHAQHQRAAQS